MTTWSVELSEFDLSYKSKGAMKALFLADFLVQIPRLGEDLDTWQLQIDESSNKKADKVGIILEELDKMALEKSI